MSKRINPSYNVALMASAGTGKTYNLALRAVAALMREHVVTQTLYDIGGRESSKLKTYSAGKILCITFTRKATAEMSGRVSEYLTELANGQLDESKNEYQVIANVLNITKPMEMRQRAQKVLEQLYKDPSILQIRTIDGFVNTILKLFPFEADIRPDFEIMDSESTKNIKYEAFEIAFEKYFSKDEYHALFNRYISWTGLVPRKFIDNLRDSVIDTVLERSITIEQQLKDAESITLEDLQMTMDEAEINDAEIAEHVGKMLEIIEKHSKTRKIYTHLEKRIPTFKKLVAKKISVESCFADFKYFDPSNKFKPLNGKELMPESYDHCYDKFDKLLKKYVNYIEKLDMMLLLHISVRVQAVVNKVKADRGILSFSDVTYTTYHMLRQPEHGITNDFLYFRLDGRLEHILIDEFQDTSDVQWKLLQPLVEEAMAGAGQSGKVGSFFCVGDPKQTIYRFRGSNPGFFQSIINQYKGRLIREELDENYRSDKAVVAFVNMLFKNANEYLNGGNNVTFDFTEQKPASECEGYVSVAVATGEKVADVNEKRLECLKKQLDEIVGGGWAYGDIAILVSTRTAGFRVQNYLDDLNIPSHITFTENLTQTSVFIVLKALLSYICVQDKLSLAEFLFTPPSILPQSMLLDDTRFNDIKSKLDNVLLESEKLSIYKRIKLLDGIFSIVQRFYNDPNMYVLMNIICISMPAITNPLEFSEKIEALAMNTPAITSNISANSVAIMTVHSSKGLEFPVVIIHDVRKSLTIRSDTRYFINDFYENSKLYKRLPRQYEKYYSDEYISAEEIEVTLTKYGIINELYVAATRASHALYYTIGNTGKKTNDSDKYVFDLFENGYTAGILPLAKDIYSNKADNRIQDKISDTYNNISSQLSINKAHEMSQRHKTIDIDNIQSHEPYISRQYGTFIHEIIYQMQDFTASSVDSAVDKAWNQYGYYLTSDMKQRAQKTIISLINNEIWQDILADSEIYREKVISDNGKVLIVDLYALKKEILIVIDFKTSAPNGKRHNEYIEQINAYQRVLSKQYKLQTKAYLIYLDNSQISVEEISSAMIL